MPWRLNPRSALPRSWAGAPKAANRYYMGASPAQLNGVDAGAPDREPAPIVSLSVGSTGMQRSALWARKMTALGCRSRIQSLVVYDCNATNIRLWRQAAQESGLERLSVVPEYLPLSEGFLRQPNFFMDRYGAIERDVERIVNEMERRANEIGSRPQLIIEWLGFGGHARLGHLIHEHVASRFPQTRFLPVYCLPAERALEQNIRDYDLWSEAESVIGTTPSLLTDNRTAGSLTALDERVALGLAAVEACWRFRPESGTLAETASMFALRESRWLSLEMADLPYQAGRSAKRSYADGMISHEERQACVMVAQSVKEAIWRIAAPVHDEKVTGYFDPPPADGEQRIYCLLPFAPSLVERIEEDVADQLQRETFNGPYPGARVAFAAADSQWGPNRKEFSYGHVCKLAGRPTEPLPPSLTRILDNDGRLRQRRRVLSRGETLLLEMGQSLERPKRKKGPDGG